MMRQMGSTRRRVAGRAWLLGCLVGAAWGHPAGAQPGAQPAVPVLDLEDPQACSACHAAVVTEWQGSQHARAHHDADPIYAALRQARIKRQGPGVVDACAQCHTPRAATPDEDTVAAHAGVSCAACHGVAAVSAQGVGRARFTAGAPGTLYGARRAAGDPMPGPHALGPPAEHLRDGHTLCLACHEQLSNPHGVSSCATGLEYGAPGGGFPQQTCVDCHMPTLAAPSGAVDRDRTHRSHAFIGAVHRHRAAVAGVSAAGSAVPGGSDPAAGSAQAVPEDGLGAPVALALSVTQPSTANASGTPGTLATLTLNLRNQSGHRWPTGFPGRLAQVAVEGRDAAGAVVWSPPPAALGRGFVDAEGQPTFAAFAVRQTHDTRLHPGETRPLRWPLPPAVQTVEATVRLWLVAPPAALKLGLTERPEARPRTVQTATWRR